MSGEEMKSYLKQRGITLATIAEGLGISPQNLNGKLKAKSLKTDFVSQIKAIINNHASPLSEEMEGAVIGSNINGSNSSNVRQTITADGEALIRENEVLRQQNQFQQKQIESQQKQIDALLALVSK